MRSSRELLAAIAAGNDEPQAELEARYRPVLQAFARRVGVDEQIVAGVSGAAFVGFFGALRAGPFDAEVETRERLFAQARDRIAEASLRATDTLQSDEALREAWNAEWRQGLVRFSIQALSQAEDTDARALQAFELHAIEKRSAVEIAKELSMTPTAVFAAKSLLLARLEELMLRLEHEF